MPTYVALLDWTDQGVRDFKGASTRRSRAKSERETRRPVHQRLVDGHARPRCNGRSAEDETLAAALLSTAGQGKVRTTDLRAFTQEEMRNLIGKV